MISVSRNFIIKVIDHLDEFGLVQLAEYVVKNDVKDIVMLIRKEYNASSFLDALKSWLEVSGFPYRHEIKDGEHNYVIQHDMGKKWSLYLAKVFQYVFEELVSKKIECDTTHNTVCFKINVGGGEDH